MTDHPSILAWKIPWTEEPGRLQSIESQKVRQDLATVHTHTHTHTNTHNLVLKSPQDIFAIIVIKVIHSPANSNVSILMCSLILKENFCSEILLRNV